MKESKIWNPARVDEKIAENKDWVKCYTVAIPNLPPLPNRHVRRFLKYVSKLEGIVGFRPEYPHGTLILFKTENDAKRAKNSIVNYPNYNCGIGNNIGEVYIPKEYMQEAEKGDN